ncbi:MAG: protein translocase subunit SecF [Cellvibrionales bacterium]|nr:protein translocase subunit SecF [Cellvibrionales bacterium]
MDTPKKIIDFMRWRGLAALLSAIILVASIASLALQGLNLGLDFSGGTLLELRYDRPADVQQVRTQMLEQGLDSAVVVHFGSDKDIMVRLKDNLGQTRAEELAAQLAQTANAEVQLQRVEYVGPQIGEELREDGGLGLVTALLIVMVYVALRFQYKFSIGAVVALFHDVLFTLGLFSLFQWQFDLTVLAALLALIGYSLNDTIVVFDRIRENFRTLRDSSPTATINLSLTQTLSRTLVTSLTTLLVLLVLFFYGGEMIHNFALGLIIGVLVGTYSSVFVATNVLLALKVAAIDLAPPEETNQDRDLQPEVPYS